MLSSTTSTLSMLSKFFLFILLNFASDTSLQSVLAAPPRGRKSYDDLPSLENLKFETLSTHPKSSENPPSSPLDARQLRYDELNKIHPARLYGDFYTYAYYFVSLLIGSPTPQRTSVIVDTGSGICAFPCVGCGHCGHQHHVDAAFDPSKSSSLEWATCSAGSAKWSSTTCTCDNASGKCTYYQGYMEGSSISGDWFIDDVRLGDAVQGNPAVRGYMGCHRKEDNLFYTQAANGILGLAGEKLVGIGDGNSLAGIPSDLFTFPTILRPYFADGAGEVNTRVFSLCFAQSGGRLIVGGYNSSYHLSDGISYVPLGTPTRFYVVSLEGMRVSDSRLTVDGGMFLSLNLFGRTILDCGTTFTYFPQKIYQALKAKLISDCQTSGKCGDSHGSRSECWNWPGAINISPESEQWLEAIDNDFPKIELVISGTVIRWRPRSWLHMVGGRTGSYDRVCLGIDQDPRDTVLGASFFIDHNMIFDLENKRVGIVDANCPDYTFGKRPRGPLDCDFDSTTGTGGGSSCPGHETGIGPARIDDVGFYANVTLPILGNVGGGGPGAVGRGSATEPVSRNFVPEEDVSRGVRKSQILLPLASGVVALSLFGLAVVTAVFTRGF